VDREAERLDLAIPPVTRSPSSTTTRTSRTRRPGTSWANRAAGQDQTAGGRLASQRTV